METTVKTICDFEYKHPRALSVPKKDKPPVLEHSEVTDGHEKMDRDFNWEDNRRGRGAGGGRSFG